MVSTELYVLPVPVETHSKQLLKERQGRREEGRGAPLGPPTHRANIPLAQREGGGPAPSQARPLPLPLWGTEGGRAWRSSERQIGKHHPRGPGEPEPGLGEGDVGRGLLFQVPKTEVTTPAPFRGLRHGGAQAVHVVTPIAVVTKQQLVVVLRGAAQAARLALDALPAVGPHGRRHVHRKL